MPPKNNPFKKANAGTGSASAQASAPLTRSNLGNNIANDVSGFTDECRRVYTGAFSIQRSNQWEPPRSDNRGDDGVRIHSLNITCHFLCLKPHFARVWTKPRIGR